MCNYVLMGYLVYLVQIGQICISYEGRFSVQDISNEAVKIKTIKQHCIRPHNRPQSLLVYALPVAVYISQICTAILCNVLIYFNSSIYIKTIVL